MKLERNKLLPSDDLRGPEQAWTTAWAIADALRWEWITQTGIPSQGTVLIVEDLEAAITRELGPRKHKGG